MGAGRKIFKWEMKMHNRKTLISIAGRSWYGGPHVACNFRVEIKEHHSQPYVVMTSHGRKIGFDTQEFMLGDPDLSGSISEALEKMLGTPPIDSTEPGVMYLTKYGDLSSFCTVSTTIWKAC